MVLHTNFMPTFYRVIKTIRTVAGYQTTLATQKGSHPERQDTMNTTQKLKKNGLPDSRYGSTRIHAEASGMKGQELEDYLAKLKEIRSANAKKGKKK